MADVTAGFLLLTGSALFYVALGVFVLTVRPRLGQNLFLAGFLVFFGLMFASFNLLSLAGVAAGVNRLVQNALGCAAFALALLLALEFPEPMARGRRRTTALAVAGGLLLAAPIAIFFDDVTLAGDAFSEGVMRALLEVNQGLIFAVYIVLALRAHASGGLSAAGVKQVGLVVAALVLLDGTVLGLLLVDAARLGLPSLVSLAATIGLAFALVAALWLRNARSWGPEASRACRNVALVIPAVVLVGMAVGTLSVPNTAFTTQPSVFLGSPFRGVARTAGVLVLAYAILHHQLLGLDVKLRWTISRGTVTGAFIAVFFVVEQLVQSAVSAEFGLLTGLVATGALFLAKKPLERFSERLAHAAVPTTTAASLASLETEGVYKDAVRVALKDDRLTAADQRKMAVLAEDLRIPARRAFELQDEVAREARP